MKIILYSQDKSNEWNNFVSNSKNATFLLNRNYMDYHSDRFDDFSLMFYDEKDQLIALLPCNISGDSAYSHQGLTYGGVITSNKIKTSQMLEVFELTLKAFKEKGLKEFIYKPIPAIYHSYPAEEDLYALFRNDASIHARGCSTSIALGSKVKFSDIRKRGAKKALKAGIVIEESKDFEEYFDIVKKVLSEKHDTKPVHNVDEISILQRSFPDNIKLFSAFLNNRMLAGVIIYESINVAHAQYIACSDEGKSLGALDLLFSTLIYEIYKDKKYFDFGISTENNGQTLNEGLISQKEGFGGRAIMYDTYKIKL